MTATSSLASIENTLVDEVVIGAMALLTEMEGLHASPDLPLRPDDVRVAVYCDEMQQSAVILRCTHPLAVQLSGRLLELAPEDVSEEDLLDATGELVNVIAGNLRGLVSSPGAMSPPFVLDSDEYAQFSTAAVNTYRMIGDGLEVVRV